MLKAYSSEDYEAQKAEKYQLLKSRYDTLKQALVDHPEYAKSFEPLPYNSGYFMCVQPIEGADAETVRQLLLEKYDTGLIALGGLLRIAFSSASAADIPAILSNVHQAIQEVKASA
jgi:DNA-binding transcriptional MocR family regulator